MQHPYRRLLALSTLTAALTLGGNSTPAFAAANSPHLFTGWMDGNPAAAPITQYGATIEVPSVEPPAAAEYAWVMAEDDVNTFTQIGWVWFQPGTYYAVNGAPVPTGAPHLFAYTDPGLVGANNLGSVGTFIMGPALTPGTSLTVDISRSGTWYDDEVQIDGLWTSMLTAQLPTNNIWLTQIESWGPLQSVCFTGRQLYAGLWVPLPAGCPDTPIAQP